MAILPWSSELQGDRGGWAAAASRIGHWPFAAHCCHETRRLTQVVWLSSGLLLLADIVWFSMSPLRFAPGNWKILGGAIAVSAVVRMFCFVVSDRLRISDHRFGLALHCIVRKSELLWRGGILLALIVSTFVIFTYLATAAALPLQDDLLAGIDRHLGFDWPQFLAATNSNAHVAAALSVCYRSTGMLLVAIVIWLCVCEQQARLAELLAILSLTFAAFAIAMLAVPTAGAFAHFAPAPETFENFADGRDMWAFYGTFLALREGTLTTIEFAHADGIVGFPSFHAALGVVTAYVLRGSRWLFWPVAALNATMMVAVLPVGGHHLVEAIGGTLTALIAIALTGLCRRRTGFGAAP